MLQPLQNPCCNQGTPTVLQSTLVAFRDPFYFGAAEHVELLKLSGYCAISSASFLISKWFRRLARERGPELSPKVGAGHGGFVSSELRTPTL